MKISVARRSKFWNRLQYRLTVTEQEPKRRKKKRQKRRERGNWMGENVWKVHIVVIRYNLPVTVPAFSDHLRSVKRDLRLAVFVEIFFSSLFFSAVAVRQLFWAVSRIPGGQGPPQRRGRKELHSWTDRRDRQGDKKNSFCAIHRVRGQHGEGTAAVKCAREPLEGGNGSAISCSTSLFVHLNALIALKFLNSSISQTWLWKTV